MPCVSTNLFYTSQFVQALPRYIPPLHGKRNSGQMLVFQEPLFGYCGVAEGGQTNEVRK
jgi:hypothetical protein